MSLYKSGTPIDSQIINKKIALGSILNMNLFDS